MSLKCVHVQQKSPSFTGDVKIKTYTLVIHFAVILICALFTAASKILLIIHK